MKVDGMPSQVVEMEAELEALKQGDPSALEAQQSSLEAKVETPAQEPEAKAQPDLPVETKEQPSQAVPAQTGESAKAPADELERAKSRAASAEGIIKAQSKEINSIKAQATQLAQELQQFKAMLALRASQSEQAPKQVEKVKSKPSPKMVEALGDELAQQLVDDLQEQMEAKIKPLYESMKPIESQVQSTAEQVRQAEQIAFQRELQKAIPDYAELDQSGTEFDYWLKTDVPNLGQNYDSILNHAFKMRQIEPFRWVVSEYKRQRGIEDVKPQSSPSARLESQIAPPKSGSVPALVPAAKPVISMEDYENKVNEYASGHLSEKAWVEYEKQFKEALQEGRVK